MLYSYRGKRKRRNRIDRIACFAFMGMFAAVLAVSAAMLVKGYVQSHQEQSAFDGLSAIVAQAEEIVSVEVATNDTHDANSSTSTDEQKDTVLLQYSELYAMNSDMVGWLNIDSAGISLPVMLTPDDPQYYLRRAFDKTDSQSGTPFIGKGGTVDSDCLIIYSHNMKNNTMFGQLDRYAKEDFWMENRTFSFDSIYDERQYEVFAAVECSILKENDEGFRYYNCAGDLNATAFDELVGWLTEQAIYDTGVIPAYGDQILILSTCSYHTNNGRFIVAARRSEL